MLDMVRKRTNSEFIINFVKSIMFDYYLKVGLFTYIFTLEEKYTYTWPEFWVFPKHAFNKASAENRNKEND